MYIFAEENGIALRNPAFYVYCLDETNFRTFFNEVFLKKVFWLPGNG